MQDYLSSPCFLKKKQFHFAGPTGHEHDHNRHSGHRQRSCLLLRKSRNLRIRLRGYFYCSFLIKYLFRTLKVSCLAIRWSARAWTRRVECSPKSSPSSAIQMVFSLNFWTLERLSKLAEELEHIAVDKSRNILYCLGRKGTIQVECELTFEIQLSSSPFLGNDQLPRILLYSLEIWFFFPFSNNGFLPGLWSRSGWRSVHPVPLTHCRPNRCEFIYQLFFFFFFFKFIFFPEWIPAADQLWLWGRVVHEDRHDLPPRSPPVQQPQFGQFIIVVYLSLTNCPLFMSSTIRFQIAVTAKGVRIYFSVLKRPLAYTGPPVRNAADGQYLTQVAYKVILL